jgi:sugar phosphate isomerase/epimerase
VGLLLDTWQWWVGGGDVEKLRSLRGEQILSVRLADIPADTDFTTITEEQRLMPGEGGTIDSAAVLAALEELGFDGPVAVAPSPALFKGQKRESIIKGASAALDALLDAAAADKPVAAIEK